MGSWKKFNVLFEESTAFFISDTVTNGQIWGGLRTLPALRFVGHTECTYPRSWRRIEPKEFGYRESGLVDQSYHRIQDLPNRAMSDLSVLTKQYYEDNFPIYSGRQLLEQYLGSDFQLVLVADGPNFELNGATRPLRDEDLIDEHWEYADVYDAITEYYAQSGLELPLKDSKNLYMNDNALIYQLVTGTRLTRLEDLFEVIPEAPYLPLVKGFSRVFGDPKTYGTKPLASDDAIYEFSKWLRRRAEFDPRTAKRVARNLNDTAALNERLFSDQVRHKLDQMGLARDALSVLDTEASPIHARYATALSEMTTP